MTARFAEAYLRKLRERARAAGNEWAVAYWSRELWRDYVRARYVAVAQEAEQATQCAASGER